MGVEPTRPCGQGILSPQRLPFRHSAHRTTVCLPEAYVCILQGVRRQASRLAGLDCPGQSRSLSITLLSRKNRDSFERLTSRTDILWKSPPNARPFLNRDHRATTLLCRNTRPISTKKQPMTFAPQPWALLTSPNLTVYSKMSFSVNQAKCLIL